MEGTIHDFRLKSPCSISIIGPSQSGKSTLINELIKNRNTWFDTPITKVIYVYYRLNETLVNQANEDPDFLLAESIEAGNKLLEPNCLLILDDQMFELTRKPALDIVSEYFTCGIHHLPFNCVLVLQRAYNKHTKLLVDGSQYCVLFDQPKDRTVITNIAKQFSPHNIHWVQEAYKDATERRHGYIVIDCCTGTNESLRLRNFLYPSDGFENKIYTSK